jgi:hypothetical protein
MELVASVLEARDVTAAIREGANADLLGEEERLYWETLIAHFDQFHEVPSIDHFRNLCPAYIHQKPKDNLQVIIHQLKTWKLGADIEDALESIDNEVHMDPWAAKSLLVNLSDKINVSNQRGNTDHVVGQDRERVLQRLGRLRSGGGLIGLPWPWEHLNRNSVGLVAGRPTTSTAGRSRRRRSSSCTWPFSLP